MAIKLPKIKKDNTAFVNFLRKLEQERERVESSTLSGDNLGRISDEILDTIGTNEDIVKIFPDLEMAFKILTYSIMSPNDMLNTGLIYKVEDDFLPQDLRSIISELISKHIEKNYYLENKLYEIIRETLFDKGAYVTVVIPQVSLMDLNKQSLKVSNEKKRITMGEFVSDISKIEKDIFLEYEHGTTVNQDTILPDLKNEKIIVGDDAIGIEFTDNLAILDSLNTYSKLVDEMDMLRFGNEKNISSAQGFEKIFKNKKKKGNSEVTILKTIEELGGSTMGKPLCMKLPVNSVIPIHSKEDTSRHLGYFVLTENGSPVTNTKNFDLTKKELDEYITRFNGDVLKKTKDSLYGISKETTTLKGMEEIYTKILLERLNTKINNTVLKDLGEVGELNEAYELLFSRSLRNKKTNIVFVPSSLMSYFAIDYKENGVGKSLLEDVSVMISVRAMLFFAGIMATVQNQIPNTNINVDMDKDDPDPNKTMKKIQESFSKHRRIKYPFNSKRVDNFVDWAHKVGFTYNFKNHPHLPDIDIEVEEKTGDKKTIDTDLEEKIQKYILLHFGLTPEKVNNAFESNFATSISSNDIILAKKIAGDQMMLNPHITKYVKIISTNDGLIRDKIAKLISTKKSSLLKRFDKEDQAKLKELGEDEMIAWLVTRAIDGLTVTLPKPQVNANTDLSEAFIKYRDELEEAVSIFMSEESLPSEFSDENLSQDLEDFKNAAMHVLLRKWAVNNNYLESLQQMLTVDQDGIPVIDLMDEYNGFMKNYAIAFKRFYKDNEKVKEIVKKSIPDKKEEKEDIGEDLDDDEGKDIKIDGGEKDTKIDEE